MTGVERIAAERERQIRVEGWTDQHDDSHFDGQLTIAGASYADLAAYQAGLEGPLNPKSSMYKPPVGWPWAASWWKPSPDPIRNLEKAGALIAAEIDRLLRKSDQ